MKRNKLLLPFLLILLLNSCQSTINTSNNSTNDYNIIPIPNEIMPQDGRYTFNESTPIFLIPDIEPMRVVGRQLEQIIEANSGFTAGVQGNQKGNKGKGIYCQIIPSIKGREAYELTILEDKITIKGASPAGIFYGIQSLLQLMPTDKNETLSVPNCTIKDAPRFAYRGMHLDVCRHFFPVDFVKKYIDQLAFHKMNYFHWHLTEDQGWRIEIKKYPKLTSVGAYRKETLIGHFSDKPQRFDGKKYGGFYTQEEVKEIVKYAQDRQITVIPEIEMPGHAQAALAAYPELACTKGPFEAATKWGVFEDVFCPTETTFEFLENVIDEVATLFPSPYIHIGGDECPKVRWKKSAFCQQLMKKEGLKDEMELQSYFIRRMEKYINSKGRKIIGWDEILEGGLAPNATVMSWRGTEGGIEAAKEGHDVVMTPGSHCYFDHYQSQSKDEPTAIGGFTSLEKVYSYEPIPEELNAEEAKHILGAQGNLWTEYVPTPEQAEYMAFPRLCALSEVVWSTKEQRDWADFSGRMNVHFKQLENRNINFAKHFFDVSASIKTNKQGNLEVDLQRNDETYDIFYTLDGTTPTRQSSTYQPPLVIDKNAKFRAMTIGENKTNVFELDFEKHKAVGKKITLKTEPNERYAGAQGATTLIDGLGGGETFNGEKWLGFEGTDLEAVIEFEKAETLSHVFIRTLKSNDAWIYLPSEVKASFSEDGKTYNILDGFGADKIKKMGDIHLNFSPTPVKFLKIEVKNKGIIPDGLPGAGHGAWLFLDEIKVQ